MACDFRLPLAEASAEPTMLTIARLDRAPHGTQGGELLHEVQPSRPHLPVFRVYRTPGWLSFEHGERHFYWRGQRLGYMATPFEPTQLGTCLTRLILPLIALRQRPDLVALHGSTVVHGGRAWVIVGAAGAGKTTALVGLLARGGLLVSDDFTIVSTLDLHAIAGPPEVRIRSGTPPIQCVDDGLVPESGKRWFRVDATHVAPAQSSIAAVIQMEPVARPEPTSLERLTGATALRTLLANTFALSHAPADERAERFRKVASLAAAVPTYRCTYGKRGTDLKEHLNRLFAFVSAGSGDRTQP